MKLLDIYSLLLSNWINGGNFSRRQKMQAGDIVPEYNQIYTKSSIKRIFRIAGIKPENVNICFIDYIRDHMFDLNPNVECIISIQNWPVRLDVNGDKFNRQMSKASEAYSSYKEAYDSQSGMARLTGKTYRLPGGGRFRMSKEKLDDLKQVFLSYYYLYNHISAGGSVTLTEIFIELVGGEPRDVKHAADDLYGILGPLSVGCEEIKGIPKTYLLECGLAVPQPLKLNKKFLPQLLFTNENMVAFSSYKSRGLVSDSGILMGVDFRSRLPFLIDLFKAPSAQVFLLMGKTGSGKTYSAWQMALSALAIGEYVTAIDIKGREWSRLDGLVSTKILTFDERHPSFVNTLRLDDIDVTTSNAAELYNTAVKGTVTLLSLIVNLQIHEGNPNDLELVLREAVTKLYSTRRVDPNNPESFKNTSGMKYSDVLPILESLSTTVSYTQEQKKMVTLARSRCHAYLGDAGIFAEAFQNEVTLHDVLEYPLVIYEFNKNQNAMTDSLDVIRIFFLQFLDSKKKTALRERGKFLFCFYEELQRCDQFANLLSYICAETTGSRSNNAVIVLLLNSLKVLQGKEAQDIRSNITSFLCGSVEDNDIRSIREDFRRPWLAHQLELFQEKPNIFRNCFAADVDNGVSTISTVYKVQLPEDLAVRFRTRTVRDGD